MDGISSIERTEFVHDEPSESHCLAASQPESHGNHHFKAVHVIANPVVQPDMSHRFLFRQFIVFVNDSNSLTNIATEHIERIAHLCCVIQTGAVGIVTAPFSVIVIIPLSMSASFFIV